MTAVPLYHVDAFSNGPFTGNPAAVCLLQEAAPAPWMQHVAAEMNLSETAFVVAGDGALSLRWFTPALEVPLCGHATLATAHALWESGWVPDDANIRFDTRSGVLTAARAGEAIELDFPAIPTDAATNAVDDVITALGATPIDVRSTPYRDLDDVDLLLVFEDATTVRSLTPRLDLLAASTRAGVIVTARGDDPSYDFVSRYFAPFAGIDEDPVTGSAHCVLAPYWAAQLGRERMTGYQASARGGKVGVAMHGDRVTLSGHATTIAVGEMRVLPGG
ncbi:MAG: PhzF family phenazine biosynthesis protein [Planctomycetota bacterium]